MGQHQADTLREVFYVSRALLGPDEVQPLLTRARLNNQRLGLTGALLYSGGHFAQVLEGPGEVLAQVMDAIARDARHDQLRCLQQGDIAQRRLGDWDMAFLNGQGADDLLQQLLWSEQDLPPERVQRLMQHLLAAAGSADQVRSSGARNS